MKISYKFLNFALFYASISTAFPVISASAQTIIPDKTLPNASQVTQNNNTLVITGGTQAGNNLFHSFQNFSIPENLTGYFNNALNVENIISRVTGKNISNINGIIRANGQANLFLINPQGIVFGEKATLNIGGSFLATTATSLKFADGKEFSTVISSEKPLLSVSTPLGLQFGKNPEKITNASISPLIDPITGDIIKDDDGTNVFGGLQVALGKTIALVGGDIAFPGGLATVFSGRIDLGSVGDNSFVNIAKNGNSWQLSYPGVVNYRDIQFSNFGNLTSYEGGSIQVTGGNISLLSQAYILSKTLSNQNAADIKIDANKLTLLDGAEIYSITSEENKQNAADIKIDVNKLTLLNGGRILSSTSGDGNTGKINVTARDSIEARGGFIGETWFPSGILTEVFKDAKGNAGSIQITTNQLKIFAGAQISTTTFGKGNAGDMVVNAKDITISGSATNPDGSLYKEDGLAFSSGLYTAAEESSSGKGGNLLVVGDRLRLTNGGILQTATFSSGDAGNLTVKMYQLVEISGKDAENIFPSGFFAASGGITGVIAGIITATGKGGNILLKTKELRVFDGAALAVGTINPNNQKGAGNLQINAQKITLNNRGRLVAETASGQGGNINITVKDLLLLRRNSQISTSAGVVDAGGDGGNITINAKSGFIVAAPLENSDIIANAFTGKGGAVIIEAKNIFNLTPRTRQELAILRPDDLDPQQLISNDITAISQQNPSLSGSVIINTPDVDPSRGLVQLPDNLTDASQQIVNRCKPGQGNLANSFIITGRGGIAASPTDILQPDMVTAPWISLDGTEETVKGETITPPNTPKIVEAQGWIRHQNGEVFLVAQAPEVTVNSQKIASINCGV
ncbi:two-partner secretion domain-containing protein [Calothrix sp. 336/3]|uniref:two-partner secretion domain-containing protein n=1 Tax=Calothrix sp. 336/3 TaxID=1337936 RepID=UPI0006243BFD|nr:filamentous hemagglutinin N-terminal domain-containing protein [Calothrix sp. 336/3]AKG19937.1 hypothetical protein IJ00_00145 [Calothrix sp. 336/3]